MNDPKTLADRSWQNPEAGNKALAHAQICASSSTNTSTNSSTNTSSSGTARSSGMQMRQCCNVVMLYAQMLPKEGSSHPEYPP